MFERTRRWIESESAVRGCADDDAERRRRGSVISRAVGVLLRLDRTHRGPDRGLCTRNLRTPGQY